MNEIEGTGREQIVEDGNFGGGGSTPGTPTASNPPGTVTRPGGTPYNNPAPPAGTPGPAQYISPITGKPVTKWEYMKDLEELEVRAKYLSGKISNATYTAEIIRINGGRNPSPTSPAPAEKPTPDGGETPGAGTPGTAGAGTLASLLETGKKYWWAVFGVVGLAYVARRQNEE